MPEASTQALDEAVRSLVLAFDLTPEDVIRVRAGQPRRTVTEAVDSIYPKASPSQRKNFDKPKSRFVKRFGGLDFATVDYEMLDDLAEELYDEALIEGFSGAYTHEHTVGFLRWLFLEAKKRGYRRDNPSEGLRAKPRPISPRRSLEDFELDCYFNTCQFSGNDPLLDTLLFWLPRETAARPVSCCNARLEDLDEAVGGIRLRGKAAHNPMLPLSPSLFRALVGLHRQRAIPTEDGIDYLLRRKDGSPLTYRRFEYVAQRLQRAHPWAKRLGASAYYLRHTTLRDIRRATNRDLAMAYAGHYKADAIDTYADFEFDELRVAHDTVFGQDVPLPSHFRRTALAG